MTDPIRDAAQALIDAIDAVTNGAGTPESLQPAVLGLRAALSAPQPAADERVAEHIRTVSKACAASCSVGIAAAMNQGQLDAAYVEESAALAAVESSARALLAAGREEVAALQAQIAELEARQVPNGWVAVPYDPTLDMLIRGIPERSQYGLQYAEACYRAMIAAAPSKPTTHPPEGREDAQQEQSK